MDSIRLALTLLLIFVNKVDLIQFYTEKTVVILIRSTKMTIVLEPKMLFFWGFDIYGLLYFGLKI